MAAAISSTPRLSTVLLLLAAAIFSAAQLSSGDATFAATGLSVLNSGERLNSGQYLQQGCYKLIMQADCNLVLYKNGKAVWWSGTNGKGTNCYLQLLANGELAVFSGINTFVWRTETSGQFGRYVLVLHQNGNVIVHSNSVWSTGTSELVHPRK